MTRILKDRGIVLKRKKYRETSKLVTIFAERAGKLNLIAKGVRTPKSKLSSILEPINFIEFVYYEKPTRDLQFLSTAEFINDFYHIKSNFEKLKISLIILELTNVFSHEGEASQELFNLVIKTLELLNQKLDSSDLLLLNFLIKLCEISGYPIFSGLCPFCYKLLDLNDNNFLLTRNYGIICINCQNFANSYIDITENQKQVISRLLSQDAELETFQDSINKSELKKIISVILDFLSYHVHEIKKINSMELF